MVRTLEADRFVKIRLDDGEVQYAQLHQDVACNDSLSQPVETLFYFIFDPLTSKGRPHGLCTAESSEVTILDVIERLPVTGDFEIDSVDWFFRLENPSNEERPASAASFISMVLTKLADAEFMDPQRIHEQTLRAHWFTPLGIDFLRQHYRSMKAVYIKTGVLPSNEIMQYLLEATRHSRTVDADWANCRVPA